MTIPDSLQQIYFLGVHPEKQSAVAEHLLLSNAKEPLEHAGRWHLFARLARPGLIAMRSVTRTTGLDLFLLDQQMEGVEDVAEILGFGLHNSPSPTSPGKASGWPDFELQQSNGSPGCLFLTFVRLNWDALMDHAVWTQCHLSPPSRTQVLRAIAATLTRAAHLCAHSDLLEHFHIVGGTGDCDIIITGVVRRRTALDRFLLILAQLGTDSLAAELGLPPAAVAELTLWYPICASSTTELGVPWGDYAEVQHVTRQVIENHQPTYKHTHQAAAATAYTSSPQELARHALNQPELKLGQRLDTLLEGGLRSAVFLRRTHSFLTDVRRAVGAITPPEWTLQAVLGEADMLLRRNEEVSTASPTAQDRAGQPPPDALSNLLLLLGRLDAQNALEPDFPRRIAVVITFDRHSHLPAPTRQALLQVVATAPASSCPVQQHSTAEDLEALETCKNLLTKMLHTRRREEYRILERMVERAVTLQRQHDLSRELRSLARLILRRLARALARLVREGSAADPKIDDPAQARSNEDARGNEKFIASGMHLDRTLQHHARGSVPLLLATATQARSADHFGSETTLTSALGASASSVARRLLHHLDQHIPDSIRQVDHWSLLKEALEDLKAPILYASHDPNFELITPLCMIRVPRWVIWYPTVSSYVLHEVGHEVFHCGRLRIQADRIAWAAIQQLLPRDKETDASGLPDQPTALSAATSSTNTEWKKNIALLKCHLIGTQEPEPQVTLDPAAGAPAAVLWIEQLLSERIDPLINPQSFAARDWYEQLDEVAAQLFCHRYSYWPEDGSEVGSDRHIYDVLEHIAPLSHRMERTHRLLCITRELAVRIALRLIEAAEHGQNPWHMSEEALIACVQSQVDIFRQCLARWIAAPPVPFEDNKQNRRLYQDVLDIYHQLLDFPVQGPQDEPNYQTPIGKALNWGIFVALLAASHAIITEPPAVAITQHLWQAIFKTSRDADTATPSQRAQEDHIVASLSQGIVPAATSLWPERLPRRLHDALRKTGSSVNLPQRFALTLALADWMVVNDEVDTVLSPQRGPAT